MKKIFIYILLFSYSLIEAQSLSNDDFCFANSIRLGDSAKYTQPIIVDMNHDNQKDLVIYNLDSQKILWFKNNGGMFNVTPNVYPVAAIDMAVGDFDGDNFPDVAILYNTNGLVKVLKNVGGNYLDNPIAFSPPTTFSIGIDVAQSIYVKNIDNEQYDDIIVFGNKAITSEYFILPSLGAFTFDNSYPTKIISATLFSSTTKPLVTFGDYNNDNLLDFAYSIYGGLSIKTMMSSSATNPLYMGIPNTTTLSVTGALGCYQLETSDYNSDNYQDIGYSSGGTNGGFYWHMNYMGSSFYQLNFFPGSNAFDFSFKDFNNDNINDYLSFSTSANSLLINEGIPTNTLSTANYTFFATSTTTITSHIATADIDNNTLLDIVMAGTESIKGYIRYIKNFSHRVNAISNNGGVVCLNPSPSPVILTAQTNNPNTGYYIWSNSSNTITSVQSFTTTTPSVYSVTYNFTLASGGSCSLKSNNINVVTNATGNLPTIALSSPAFTSACIGDNYPNTNLALFANSSDLYASWYQGYNYSNPISTSSGMAVILITPGEHIYRFEAYDNGCIATQTVMVKGIQAPILPSNANTYNICAGTTLTLTVQPINNVPVSAYDWNYTSSNTTSLAVVSPTNTSIYSVVANNAGCYSDSLKNYVYIMPSPVLNASYTSTICSGTPANINYNTPFGNSYNYFTTSSSASTFTNNSINEALQNPTTYTASVTDITNNCKKDSVFTINVIATPTLSVNSATICSGQQATLTVSGATSFQWNNSGGAIISTATVALPSPTNTSFYSVTGYNGSCVTTKSVTVFVNPTPIVSISASSNSICPVIETVTLTAPTNSNWNYLWSNGSTSSVITNTIGLLSTTYTLSAKDATTGCIGIATITIISKPLPSLSITASNTIVCENTFINLSASGTAMTYTWLSTSTFSLGNNFSVTALSPQTYTVYGTGINGCINRATSFIDVYSHQSVNAFATPSIICAGSSSTLSVNGGTPTISSYQGEVVTPSSNEIYPITIMYGIGCLFTDTAFVFINNNCSFLKQNTAFSPNGDGRNETFIIDNISDSDHVYIYDRWGLLLYHSVNYNKEPWDGRHKGKILPSGTYFYVVEYNDGRKPMKNWVELMGNKD